MEPLEEHGKIQGNLKNQIFSNVDQLLTVNENLLAEIQARIDSSDLGSVSVGDIFFRRVLSPSFSIIITLTSLLCETQAPILLATYMIYCQNYDLALHTIDQVTTDMPEF